MAWLVQTQTKPQTTKPYLEINSFIHPYKLNKLALNINIIIFLVKHMEYLIINAFELFCYFNYASFPGSLVVYLLNN